jgi:RNA polymerase sigma-70 factor (ECF subfamily)
MTEVSQQVRAVETRTFDDLVVRQSRFVFRVAYAILRNPDDSEDVVQETFLKLYRNGAWARIEDERAFLARAAWRIAVDRRASRARGEVTCPPGFNEVTPETTAMESQRNSAVHRLIDALPDELRVPLALSTVDEMTSTEIAAVMGIPEGTVRTRLLRARQVLKQKLAAGGRL